MGKGGQGVQSTRASKAFSWEEIKKHNRTDDRWLVIDGQVYDITRWAIRHPGGSRVISHYAGQDATEAFQAFHKNESPKKYLKPIHIGYLKKQEYTQEDIQKDFQDLRNTANKMGLFKPSFTFYALTLGHILAMEILAYLTLWYYGTGWGPFIVSVLLYSTVQVQAGWLQHDFGHLSVFKNTTVDRIFHHFTMGCTKGASPHWWNHLHYQHHSKPNVINKDPDVRIDKMFVVGETMPVQVAQTKKSSMPYNYQHRYFFIIGPPLLFPVYFQFMLFRHIYIRRLWVDFITVMSFYIKLFLLYTPLLGFGWAVAYYFIIRCLESNWFTWVAQSNHIPMEIEEDKEKPWVPLQLHATCDVEQSFFNDWFTGHLNFQIEHHLFPTMPRHNLYKIAPLVQSLCEKHGIPYQVKTLSTAFADIIRSLKHSGELWHATYQAFHSD